MIILKHIKGANRNDLMSERHKHIAKDKLDSTLLIDSILVEKLDCIDGVNEYRIELMKTDKIYKLIKLTLTSGDVTKDVNVIWRYDGSFETSNSITAFKTFRDIKHGNFKSLQQKCLNKY